MQTSADESWWSPYSKNSRKSFGVIRNRFSGPYGSNLKERPVSKLFLYLGHEAWAETWINGGKIPFALASSYRSIERCGILTPDEVKQFRTEGASIEDLEKSSFLKISGSGGVRDIKIVDCVSNGRAIPNTRIDHYEEDALILSFSLVASKSNMNMFENKAFCIEITDFGALIESIKDQYSGQICYGKVLYTEGSHRSNFVKGQEDGWQAEFRIALPNPSIKSLSIQIPAVASLHTLDD